MPDPHGLREAIALVLAGEKCYDLPRVCQQFGLPGGDEEEACRSKRIYVLHQLRDYSEEKVAALAETLLSAYDAPELAEKLALYRQGTTPALSELTRRKILALLGELGDELPGRLGWREFLARSWPIHTMQSEDYRFSSFPDEIHQHMVANPGDWTLDYLFDRLGALSASDARFSRFIESCVDPVVRDGPEQDGLAAEFNALLKPDGFVFRPADTLSGATIYRVVRLSAGVAGKPKNLIFAANGPKPDLVLADAINNDIRIAKNEQYCLVYAESIPATGLLWQDLVGWWAAQARPAENKTPERALYDRLEQSLVSDPERQLFKHFFKQYHKTLGERLPALIPQVYLHYDPLTVRARAHGRVLPRQRMDFLILFSAEERVVIEIDGKHHYAAEDGTADPRRYADMVAPDRELRLGGYEVYRFGGHEFTLLGAEANLDRFFSDLFARHGRL